MPVKKIIKKIRSKIFKSDATPFSVNYASPLSVNLCCGGQKVDGYIGLDFEPGIADIVIDLRYNDLPFPDSSVDKLVCISAINYFKYQRAKEIISDVYRSMKTAGIVRFAVQDLNIIANKYVNKDREFFFQKLPDGRDRFEGITIGDKFNAWFYGYQIADNHCQYVYDYESLAQLFNEAGFSVVERKNYLESRLENIELIDNRPEQMFFLEAIK